MAFDFPNTPNVGDIAQSPSASYRWDGTKWASSSPSAPIYLPLVGGTISPGPLHINAPSNNAALFLERPSGYYNLIIGATITSPTTVSTRWQIQPGDSTAEAAGNVGSNFAINRFDNSGNYLGSPFFINRATGQITVAQVMHVNSPGIDINSTFAQVVLNKAAGGTGNWNSLVGNVNGVIRWQIQPGTAGAETGGNVGSDLGIYRYDDSGNYLGNPFTITRSNGNVSIAQALYIGSVYGIFYSGISAHSFAFGWDGTWVTAYVDTGYQYQIPSVGWVNNNFATYTWVGANFYGWGSSPTFQDMQINGNMMVANGTMYVANNYGCYWSRSSGDGAWRCAEGGTVNFTVDTGGGVSSRTWGTFPNISCNYLTNSGDTRLLNVYIDGGLGLNFRGVYGSGVWYAFGWDGTALNYAINGGGQGQLYTVGQNDGRYKAIGAYTPNQNVDYQSSPTFWNPYVNSSNGIMFAGNGNGTWIALGWYSSFPSQLTLYLNSGRAWEFCSQSNAQDFQVYGGAGGPTNLGLGFGDRDGTRGSCFVDSWSDIRIKRDIRPTEVDALGLIEAIPVRAFSYIEPMADLYAFMGKRERFSGDADIRLGLVAQELQEYIPEAVHGLPEGVHNPPDSPIPEGALMISPEPIVPYLLRAIQQLTERIKTLEARTLH